MTNLSFSALSQIKWLWTSNTSVGLSLKSKVECFNDKLHKILKYLVLNKILDIECRVLKMCRRPRRLLSHFCRLKIYRAWVFQQFLCLCELLIYIFLSITFTIAINQTLTNPPFSKYIQHLVTSRWELRTSTTQHFGLHLVLLYRCAKRSEWSICSWRIRSRQHSKSWDIPLRNVKTCKEIDEDLTVFGNLKFSDNFQSENVTIYAW